ncbi:hypothetical protein WJX81_008394 [Elliptochloris bilobata]|uniref:EIPR1-like beta-propeller domain-containing protein n=1 Tax=Elliptochloris bilobata TaxID=381761 RepID=A0AAW1RRL5_9CHLO
MKQCSQTSQPERGVTHGLKLNARALVPVVADTGRSSWIVGTNALRDENELQVLEFDADSNAVHVLSTYGHPAEVWHIASCPADAALAVTVCNEGGVYGAVLWRLPPGSGELERVADLKGHAGAVREAAWHAAEPDALVSLDEGNLRSWRLRDGAAQMTGAESAGELPQLWAGTWDPHDAHRFITAGGNHIQVWDLRAMRCSAEIEGAHQMPVRDVDVARGSPHLLLSAGDDCRLRFWDLRLGSSTKPLAELGGHSHWVWQARFCPAHDSLLLSASSDALVNLWYAPWVGAAVSAHSPARERPGGSQRGAPRGGGGGRGTREGRVRAFDDHEDSVYSVAWSAADPWTFASLSYDGRIAVNHVPSAVKYKILI